MQIIYASAVILLLWLSGVFSEVTIIGLPATAMLPENSPASTEVFSFQVSFSAGESMAGGFPRLVNFDPLTDAFGVAMDNATHAKVIVSGSPDLDFETVPNLFTFQVLVVGSAGNGDIKTLTVLLTDVDEPPVFLDEASVLYVLEKTSPGPIYEPSVYDPEQKPLAFTLIPANPAFMVDGNVGIVFTTKEFNYHVDPISFSFNLSVNDGNNTALRILIISIINVNDDKPVFLNKMTSFTVPEELSPGHVVANMTAVGPKDSPNAGLIFYTISLNDYLEINGYTGLVTIANRMDRDSDTLRHNPTIAVIITATYRFSRPPLFSALNVTVTVRDINDNPPICTSDRPRREIPETETVGALVASVTCTDNDVEPKFREYSFTSFSCVGCTQRFTLQTDGSILLNSDLDFEDPGNVNIDREYNLLVVATDKDDTSLRGDAYVYVSVTPVNEFPPVFPIPKTYFFRVSELLGRGTVIGSVKATDADLPATDIQYSLVSGGGSGGLANIFHVDPKLGRISLLTKPDFEVTPTHTLVIRAVDGDPVTPLTDTAVVTINITEANDEPPLCGPNKTNLVVSIDTRPGTSVQGFMLTCTDKDSPPTSFLYTISGATNVNNHFGFSPSAGTNITRLILREPFDFSSGIDKLWRYSLTVLISDGNVRAGRDPQTGTVIINVQVVDPDLTTIITTTTPRITYIPVTQNTFDVDDWYVWFVVALGALLLLGILAYLLYRCFRYLATKEWSCNCYCCEPETMGDKDSLIYKDPPKREVLMEVTKINTLFDGEEVDPVTKRVYEYNTKSGARRWKDAVVVSGLPTTQPDSSTLVIPRRDSPLDQPPSTAQSKSSGGKRLGSALSLDWADGKSQSSSEHQDPPLPARSRAKLKPVGVPMKAQGTSQV